MNMLLSVSYNPLTYAHAVYKDNLHYFEYTYVTGPAKIDHVSANYTWLYFC